MTKNQVHGAAGLHYAGLVLSLARGKKKNKEREEEYKERSSNHLLLLACFATTLLTRKPRSISLSLSLSGGSNRATLILHILGTNIQVFFISYFVFDDQTGQDFFNAARDGVKEISEIEAISRENRIFNRISFFDRPVAKFIRLKLGFFYLTTRKESLSIRYSEKGFRLENVELSESNEDEIRTSF